MTKCGTAHEVGDSLRSLSLPDNRARAVARWAGHVRFRALNNLHTQDPGLGPEPVLRFGRLRGTRELVNERAVSGNLTRPVLPERAQLV